LPDGLAIDSTSGERRYNMAPNQKASAKKNFCLVDLPLTQLLEKEGIT